MATSTALYKTLSPLRHNGVDVPIGTIIELTDAQAEQLIELGDVTPDDTPAKGKK